MKKFTGVMLIAGTLLIPAAGSAQTQSTKAKLAVALQSEIDQAVSAMTAAEGAGAPLYAKELYDEALWRVKFARTNQNATKSDVREDARLRAVEARFAARASEAKARLIGNSAEVRNLRTDVQRLGGKLPEVMLYDEAVRPIRQGNDSRERLEYAAAAIARSRAAGGELAPGGDLVRADELLSTGKKLTRNDRNSESADHLAFIIEMLARRAEYTARRMDVDRYLPSARLERTRLAQVASEQAAAAERRAREEAELRAAELRNQLAAEAQNRKMQEDELARLRGQVEANQQIVRDQLSRDREARLAAEQSLDRLIIQYETALATNNAAAIDQMRRQVEDQQITLRSVQERERLSEQSLRSEIDRLRGELNAEKAAGRGSSDVAAKREQQLASQQQEFDRLKAERETADQRRIETERTQQAAIAQAEQRRLVMEQEATQLRDQMAQTTAELNSAKAEIARRDITDQQRMESMQKALSSIAKTRTEARGFIVTLPGIFFDTGRTTLKSGSRNTLNRIAEQLRVNPGMKVTIEGHTDGVGSEQSNQALSEKRAEAVRSALIAQGIDASRIVASGLGESAPIATNDTAAGKQQNRRVELIIAP